METGRKQGIDLEEVYAKQVRTIIGDRLMTKMDCLRYDPFLSATVAAHLCGVVDVEKSMTNLPTMSAESQALYNFWSSGKKVFSISETLSRMLLDTDLKVPKFFLKLPFPCIYIRFPAEDIMSLFCHYDNSWMPLDGIYVMDFPEDTMPCESDAASITAKEFSMMLKDKTYALPGTTTKFIRKIIGISK